MSEAQAVTEPFVTLETAKEHIDSAFVELAQMRGMQPREHRRQEWPMGTPEYHLATAAWAVERLYQQLAQRLPLAAAMDAGDVADSIVDAIDDGDAKWR